MKRRLSLAIALIGDPAILFLDEPTVRVCSCARVRAADAGVGADGS